MAKLIAGQNAAIIDAVLAHEALMEARIRKAEADRAFLDYLAHYDGGILHEHYIVSLANRTYVISAGWQGEALEIANRTYVVSVDWAGKTLEIDAAEE